MPSREGEPHQHPIPTPQEWMETLLFWKVMNHRWTNQETVEYIYEIWPFEMDYNPRYLEKKLRYNLSCASGMGYSSKNAGVAEHDKWSQMFGLKANLACEHFIDKLFDRRSFLGTKSNT